MFLRALVSMFSIVAYPLEFLLLLSSVVIVVLMGGKVRTPFHWMLLIYLWYWDEVLLFVSEGLTGLYDIMPVCVYVLSCVCY